MAQHHNHHDWTRGALNTHAPEDPQKLMSSAIVVNNLYRYFGPLKAVDGISFEVPHGSVCGFVGANGAGKTTTMRVLATLDYPTMGQVEICGINVVNFPAKVRSLIGWMPDHFGNYEHMTVLEYLDFYARALGYAGKERQIRVQEVMEFADLIPLADRLSNKLSKGMTQRLCLGRALIHDPQVLIMDEPAAGLDPKARVELKHLIRILADEGKTIFISSHILSELGEMCDSLLFINNGRIVHHGDAESLKHGTENGGGYFFDVQVLGDAQSGIRLGCHQPLCRVHRVAEKRRAYPRRINRDRGQSALQHDQRRPPGCRIPQGTTQP